MFNINMDTIWQSAFTNAAAYFAQHFYVSPFWYWTFIGSLVIAGATAAGWYFPVLRSLAGAITMAVIAGLVGYRRGETDAERHLKRGK